MIKNLAQKIEKIIVEKITDDDMKYFENYSQLKGATEEEIQAFEKEYGISLPDEFKDLYRYKNGTAYPFCFLQTSYDVDGEAPLFLLSLDEIRDEKKYFNENKLMANDDFFSSEDIDKLDKRIKPFISNERWIPFAQMPNFDIYLLLDFDPTENGKQGKSLFMSMTLILYTMFVIVLKNYC